MSDSCLATCMLLETVCILGQFLQHFVSSENLLMIAFVKSLLSLWLCAHYFQWFTGYLQHVDLLMSHVHFVSTFNFEQVFVSKVWKTSHNVLKTQKAIYFIRNKCQVEKETSASKKTTSSISHQKLVSRRRRGAYSNIFSNSIKLTYHNKMAFSKRSS